MKKDRLKDLFIFYLFTHIFAFLSGLFGIILLIINSKEFIFSFDKVFGIILYILIICAFILIILFSIITLLPIIKDFKCIKEKKYLTINGMAVGFKENRNPESGIQINNLPIILIENVNEKIILCINQEVYIGERYQFKYLKNSKIGEVIKKLDNQ